MMLSYLLPTRNRHQRLAATLEHLASLSAAAHQATGGAEIIVVDDASDEPVRLPRRLANGMPVTVLRRPRAVGAAARNLGVHQARGEWIVMLDDDSWPLDESLIDVLQNVEQDVAVVGAEIVLPSGNHEAGGLPEVFVGCGAAIRRHAFLQAGGYDETFHYYAEEYDLCARLIMRGWRIIHDWRFRVRHEKTGEGRDMNLILHRLVRNNAWVMQRYAPAETVSAALEEVFDRYGRIAFREDASEGFQRGRGEALATLPDQPRTPMSMDLWSRFSGRAHVARTLSRFQQPQRGGVGIAHRGKNAAAIEEVLAEIGCPIVPIDDASTLVIGTLSPGPLMDADEVLRHEPRTVLRPWTPRNAPSRQWSEVVESGSVHA